jgi:hypothetical protein
MTIEELISIINATEDGEIWLYSNKLRDHLSTVEQALEEDRIYFVKTEVGNSVTEFIRVSP